MENYTLNGEQRRTANSNWRTPPKNTCLYNVMCESTTLQSQNNLGENLYLFTIFRQTQVDILYFFTIFSQAQVYIPYFSQYLDKHKLRAVMFSSHGYNVDRFSASLGIASVSGKLTSVQRGATSISDGISFFYQILLLFQRCVHC